MTIQEQSIRDLFTECHENAKTAGWWDTPISLWESMALIHSELSECLEDIREGMFVEAVESWVPGNDPPGKPRGAASELADVVIRIADTCGYHGFDLATQTHRALALGYCTDTGLTVWETSIVDTPGEPRQRMARLAAARVGRIHKQLSLAQDNPTSDFGPVVYSCVCLFAILHPEGTLFDSMRRRMDYNKTRPVRHGGKLL